jgi:hypothetical protein
MWGAKALISLATIFLSLSEADIILLLFYYVLSISVFNNYYVVKIIYDVVGCFQTN